MAKQTDRIRVLLSALFACVALQTTTATAQQLPGTGPEPDYVQVERRVKENQATHDGRVPNSLPPASQDASAFPNSICRSPELKRVLEQAIVERTGENPDLHDGSGEENLDQILSQLVPDNAADATALKQRYAQLPEQQKLGAFEICKTTEESAKAVKASVFSRGSIVSGSYQGSRIGREFTVSGTFGGMTGGTLQSLNAAMAAVAARPLVIGQGIGQSYCAQQSIRKQAAQAVNDKMLLALGIGAPKQILERFNALAVDSSPRAAAAKRQLERMLPGTEILAVCSAPAGDMPDFLQTIVARKFGRIGGVVTNFGGGPQVAEFGDLDRR